MVTYDHDNIEVNHIGRLPVIMTMQVAGLRYLDVTQLGKLGLPDNPWTATLGAQLSNTPAGHFKNHEQSSFKGP